MESGEEKTRTGYFRRLGREKKAAVEAAQLPGDRRNVRGRAVCWKPL